MARWVQLQSPAYFYPRPPRGGRRRTITSGMGASKFLSTPSARRATVFPGARSVPWLHFYPRPPRGGRHPLRQTEPLLLRISIHALREEGDDGPVGTAVVSDTISIHALREEGDLPEKATVLRSLKFLSTPSARRATCPWAFTTRVSVNFYPRPPRGGRPQCISGQPETRRFLSTPSARRATKQRGRRH